MNSEEKAELDRTETTGFGRSAEGCYWLVEEGRRPCANPAHYQRGHMSFCAAHDKKFLPAVLSEIIENPRFRDEVIRCMQEYDTDEAELWIGHRKKIGKWPAYGGRAHCVYFAAREGFVKIGRTANMQKRMHDIGKGSCMPQGMSVGPVQVLAVIHCDCTEKGCVRETHFHEKFQDEWLEGEWFLLDDVLASFIGGLKECAEGRLRDVSAPRSEAGAA